MGVLSAVIIGHVLVSVTATTHTTRQVLASPDIPLTSFSCEGRPVGYYADLDTNCKVYHMCGGAGGVQFSYRCPNTTLFHQRMMVCVHWYQVDCALSEQHYSANLLIGQPKTFFLDQPYSLKNVFPSKDWERLESAGETNKRDTRAEVVRSYNDVFREVLRRDERVVSSPRPSTNEVSALDHPGPLQGQVSKQETTRATVSKLRPTNVSFRSTIETPLFDYSTSPTRPMVATEPVTAVEPPSLNLLPPFSDQIEQTNTVELYLKDNRRSLFIPEGGRDLPADDTIVVAIPVRKDSSRFSPKTLHSRSLGSAGPCSSRCHPAFVIDKENCTPCLVLNR